jgi:proline iminopeptidase
MAYPIAQEGFVPVTGGRVWYQIVGSANATPLLTLHGGPGYPHDYLEPLADLADERPVIFYDQLGCGRSDRPDDLSLWRIERFVEELAQVREALGLERVHILGHSWGTMLATNYVLTQPAGLERLVLASPAISVPRWTQDARTYIKALPNQLQEVIKRHESGGTADAVVYQEAEKEYFRRHFCRLDPRPEPMQRAREGFSQVVYDTMWGQNEWTVSGNLKTYDRAERLREVEVPTLFTCGRFDEASPETTAYYQSCVPGAKLAIFEKSSHMPHFEEREAYLQVVRDFLR